MQAHAGELLKLGHDVTVHGVIDADAERDADGWGRVPRSLSSARFGAFRYAPTLRREVFAAKPDIVHQHALWQYPSIVARRWRRRTGRPLIVSTQGMLEPWALSNSAIKKRIASLIFERTNLQEATAIHCSPAEVAGIRKFGLRNPIAVLPNGLPSVDGRNLPRLSFFPPEPKRVLLFLGRIHPKKGIVETLDAWAQFNRDAPQVAETWHLMIAGWDDGGHVEAFRRHSDALGLSDVVSFPGSLFGDQKAAALQYASAFVLASHSEGFPMAVMEAWANALPVFMTHECNMSEAFAANAAFEVTTEPSNIARAFALHLNRSDLEQFGRDAEVYARNSYSWSAITEQLVSVYNWALRRADRPECVEL